MMVTPIVITHAPRIAEIIARLPLLNRLLVDLGDDQSIAQSLSSFSAHLGHLNRFLAEAGPGTLVLCDEIGSGSGNGDEQGNEP